MQAITDDAIVALHRKFAQSDEVFDAIYGHCRAVWSIAKQLVETNELDVDIALVKVGSLLHDIGYYQLYRTASDLGVNHMQHGRVGEELLKAEGLPEAICRIASRHTGLGTKSEVLDLSKVYGIHPPETIEERLILYADKFHSALRTPQFNSFESYRKLIENLEGDHIQYFDQLAKEFGKPNLAILSEEYNSKLV